MKFSTLSIAAALVISLGLSLNSSPVSAEVTGESTLTLWLDRGDIASIELREENGKIVGRSSFGRIGMISIESADSIWTGSADDGQVKLSCDVASCEGVIGSDSADLRLETKDGTTKLKGSLNNVSVKAKFSSEKIEVQADGALSLTRTKDGVYEGSGFIDRSFGSHFRATLKGKGSLASLTDPGLFAIYLISPFVRD